jgi:hypothetical protein
MFDMAQFAYAGAGFVLGWIAHSKFGNKIKKQSSPLTPSVETVVVPVDVVPVNQEPKDHYDAILEMVAAENRKKEKLSQILNALNTSTGKKG